MASACLLAHMSPPSAADCTVQVKLELSDTCAIQGLIGGREQANAHPAVDERHRIKELSGLERERLKFVKLLR